MMNGDALGAESAAGDTSAEKAATGGTDAGQGRPSASRQNGTRLNRLSPIAPPASEPERAEGLNTSEAAGGPDFLQKDRASSPPPVTHPWMWPDGEDASTRLFQDLPAFARTRSGPGGADASPHPPLSARAPALREVIRPLSEAERSFLTFLRASQLDDLLSEEAPLLERIREAIAFENKQRSTFGQSPLPDDVEDVMLAYVAGWGPFEYFRGLSGVTKVVINGRQAAFIEQSGSYRYWGSGLPTPLLNDLIEALTGQRLSPYHAILSTPLPDGSWLHATDASISMELALTIGRRPVIHHDAQALVAQGMLSQACLEFLDALGRARVSIILAGEPGSGKTTLANALVNRLPSGDRVVVVEDAFPELQTTRPNAVRLLSPAECSSPLLPPLSKLITQADLIAHALRLAPDHIVVGACRDEAVGTMLEAMSTCQTGWLLTLNAHSTRHALFRLEALALHKTGSPMPGVVHSLIASSIQVVAYLAHSEDGRSVRQVDAVLPNQGASGSHFQLLPLFQTARGQGQPTLQRTGARLPREIVNCLLNAQIDPTPYLGG